MVLFLLHLCVVHGLLQTSDENFKSMVLLEIFEFRKLMMCSILML